MGEEVEGTAFFAYMQEKELKIKNKELKINFSRVVFEIFIITKNAQPASASWDLRTGSQSSLSRL